MVTLTPASIFSDIATGPDLLTAYANTDVVAIYDAESATQIFENGRPLKAKLLETSRVMTHPAETGVMQADHHVINPIGITIPLIIQSENYGTIYQQIRNAFINGTLLSVQTRTGVYSNMVVADMPHDEDADKYDVITLDLHLVQIIYFDPGAQNGQPNNYAPLNPANSNTIKSGLQTGVALGKKALTTVGSLVSFASLSGRF